MQKEKELGKIVMVLCRKRGGCTGKDECDKKTWEWDIIESFVELKQRKLRKMSLDGHNKPVKGNFS